ncbi:hypothetical protein MCEREM21_01133 [Burkholderiaceae bacterium]
MSLITSPRAALRPLRLWVWLGFLLLSIVSTQWLGLQHSVGYHDNGHVAQSKVENTPDRCNDHSHSLFSLLSHDQSSIDCQLFDALTLAGIISGNPFSISVPTLFSQHFFGFAIKPVHSVSYQPYQSRAPPALIL